MVAANAKEGDKGEMSSTCHRLENNGRLLFTKYVKVYRTLQTQLLHSFHARRGGRHDRDATTTEAALGRSIAGDKSTEPRCLGSDCRKSKFLAYKRTVHRSRQTSRAAYDSGCYKQFVGSQESTLMRRNVIENLDLTSALNISDGKNLEIFKCQSRFAF